MLNEYCVTDMALESAEGVDLSNYATQKKLSYGIEKRIVNIKSVELAKIIGKDRGVYITLDCKKSVLEGKTTTNYLSACISDCVRELVGILKKSSPILVVGLGNRNIVSDALAASKHITGMILVVREDYTEKKELEICIRQLKLSDVNVLGCLFNGAKSGKKSYGKYKKYYKTYYSRA